MILRLADCPKCKGFLMLEKDIHGSYHQCLQCSYIRDLQDVDQPGERKALHEAESEASPHATLDSSGETAENIEVDAPR